MDKGLLHWYQSATFQKVLENEYPFSEQICSKMYELYEMYAHEMYALKMYEIYAQMYELHPQITCHSLEEAKSLCC